MISSVSFNETNEIIEIQNILLNLSSNNLETAEIMLSDLLFLKNDKNLQNFLDIILIFSEIRVEKIPYYCNILTFLKNHNHNLKSVFLDFPTIKL